MKRFVLILLFFAMTQVFFSFQGFAQTKCYIFFDNSASMKVFSFYERIISDIIQDKSQYEFHFVPFGENRAPKDFNRYSQFTDFMNNTTFLTTDFVQLAEFIKNTLSSDTPNPDKIIIITDGEHDNTARPSWECLSEIEVNQMIDVIELLRDYKHNITVVHIVNCPEYEVMKGKYHDQVDIETRRRRNPAISETRGETNPVIIKALTQDFLMTLAAEGEYYHCSTRNKAMHALHNNIFQVSSIPLYCDDSMYLENIPVNLQVNVLPIKRDVIENFKTLLSQEEFCFKGNTRGLTINTNSEFKISIMGGNNSVYQLKVNGESLGDMRLNTRNDWHGAVASITKKIENLITTSQRYRNDPRYMEPYCKLTLKFEGNLLFPFLDDGNFQIKQRTCEGGWEWIEAKVDFAPMARRVSIEVPMKTTGGLRISLPDNSAFFYEKTLNPNELKNFLDREEIFIRDSNYRTIPSIECDFSNFLKKNGGQLVFLSEKRKIFTGMLDDPGYINLHRGQRYWIYYIPENIEHKVVNFTTRTFSNDQDVSSVINILGQNRDALRTYSECLDAYINSNKKNISSTIKRILDSDGFVYFLLHLRSIKNHQEYRRALISIIEKTHELFSGADFEKPFSTIDLIKMDIDRVSIPLKRKYIQSRGGGMLENKLESIILFLSNPFSNLNQLKYYLDPDKYPKEKITAQNRVLFKSLEEE